MLPKIICIIVLVASCECGPGDGLSKYRGEDGGDQLRGYHQDNHKHVGPVRAKRLEGKPSSKTLSPQEIKEVEGAIQMILSGHNQDNPFTPLSLRQANEKRRPETRAIHKPRSADVISENDHIDASTKNNEYDYIIDATESTTTVTSESINADNSLDIHFTNDSNTIDSTQSTTAVSNELLSAAFDKDADVFGATESTTTTNERASIDSTFKTLTLATDEGYVSVPNDDYMHATINMLSTLPITTRTANELNSEISNDDMDETSDNDVTKTTEINIYEIETNSELTGATTNELPSLTLPPIGRTYTGDIKSEINSILGRQDDYIKHKLTTDEGPKVNYDSNVYNTRSYHGGDHDYRTVKYEDSNANQNQITDGRDDHSRSVEITDDEQGLKDTGPGGHSVEVTDDEENHNASDTGDDHSDYSVFVKLDDHQHTHRRAELTTSAVANDITTTIHKATITATSQFFDHTRAPTTTEKKTAKRTVDTEVPTTTQVTTTTTTKSTRRRIRRTRTKRTTTTRFKLDVPALLAIIANLTYDYEVNLTRKLNKTLLKYSIPTCETPTTTVKRGLFIDYEANATGTIVAKCFVCGLENYGIPREAHCGDAFAGDFLPLMPMDMTARGKISKFRKYCRYADVPGQMKNESQPRSVFGRWSGGCSVRWIDLSNVYTQRSCRSRERAILGKNFASKRMAKLEMALKNVDNGCIASPMATLVPLSRGISLYARFHACVCTGSWCNSADLRIPWTSVLVTCLLACIIPYLIGY